MPVLRTAHLQIGRQHQGLAPLECRPWRFIWNSSQYLWDRPRGQARQAPEGPRRRYRRGLRVCACTEWNPNRLPNAASCHQFPSAGAGSTLFPPASPGWAACRASNPTNTVKVCGQEMAALPVRPARAWGEGASHCCRLICCRLISHSIIRVARVRSWRSARVARCDGRNFFASPKQITSF
jgi:hypothetical protein